MDAVLEIFTRFDPDGSGIMQREALVRVLIAAGSTPAIAGEGLRFFSDELDDSVPYVRFIQWVFDASADAQNANPAAEKVNSTSQAGMLSSNRSHTFDNGATYIGEWMENNRHGQGEQAWPDGAKYEGQWEGDAMQGHGRLKRANDSVYEGQWRNGKFHGHGVYNLADGSRYEGHWEDANQHGKGVEVRPNGQKYVGQYTAGKRTGKGQLSFPDGSSYEGDFKDNYRHGVGVYQLADGRKFNGQWNSNKLHGKGLFTLGDRQSYIGEYKSGQKDGHGVSKSSNGDMYEGQWKDGKRHGIGTEIIDADDFPCQRTERTGEWKEGYHVRWLPPAAEGTAPGDPSEARPNDYMDSAALQVAKVAVEAKPSATPTPNEYEIQMGGRLARCIESQTLAVVKASYFRDCLEKKQAFGHRAELPEEAIFDGAEAAKMWYLHGYKFLVVVSYSWLSATHPDPDLFHLPFLVNFLAVLEFVYGVEQGVILDYASFWQEPRTQEQTSAFIECLSIINIPYGHARVTALKLVNTPPSETRTYFLRGWTKFESDIIDSKPAAKEQFGHFNVFTFDAENEGAMDMLEMGDPSAFWAHRRRPPLGPTRFEQEMRSLKETAESKGVRLFTNGKDQPRILDKYKEAFEHLSVVTTRLCYEWLEWGPTEATLLCEALLELRQLQELDLNNNRLGAQGGRLLAEALPGLKELLILRLSSNGIGAEGARALADALPELKALQEVDLGYNDIGAEGAIALAEALHSLKGLRTLKLAGNDIGDDGARSLAKECLGLKELRTLHLGHDCIGDEGAKALAQALPRMKGLHELKLDYNSIGDEGVMGLVEALFGLKMLQKLHVSHNNIGDKGVMALLEALPGLVALQELHLVRNVFGDDGARALAEVAIDELKAAAQAKAKTIKKIHFL